MTNSDTVTSWLESGGGSTYQNWNNLNGERSVSANNVPHRLVVSYVLDIPYGRGTLRVQHQQMAERRYRKLGR
jgi:hypothetical protein